MINECIVVLNYGKWHSMLRGIHQFCIKLSQSYRVLYVHSPGQIINYEQAPTYSIKVNKVHNNIYELSWPRWCRQIYRYPFLESILTKIRIHLIKKALRQNNFPKVRFIYVAQPNMYKYIVHFQNLKKICHIFDKYSFYGGKENKAIVEMEEKFLPLFDAVLCLSMKLYEEYKIFNRRTFYLPDGVDFKCFSRATQDSLPIPDEVRHIPKPVIGYIGNISGKVDLDLVYFLARHKLDWSFLFIGPKQLNEKDNHLFDQLCSLTNFCYIGFKPPELLPNYMRILDVGIMPYRLKSHMPWGFPLKMYEYMAAGLPSVSADLEAVKQHQGSGLVCIAHKEEEWVELIEQSLRDSEDTSLIGKRQNIAAKNTWDTRVQELLEIVDSLD